MTTATTTTNEKLYTRCGISAPAALWSDLGYQIYSNTDEIGNSRIYEMTDGRLIRARIESGANDARALVWLLGHQEQMSAECTRNTASARLADAIKALSQSAEFSQLRGSINELTRMLVDVRETRNRFGGSR